MMMMMMILLKLLLIKCCKKSYENIWSLKTRQRIMNEFG